MATAWFSTPMRLGLASLMAFVLGLYPTAALTQPVTSLPPLDDALVASPASSFQEARISVTRNAYRLGPGDVLSFQVHHQPEFSQPEILVTSDGSATFNVVGELPVGGRTLQEVRQMLEAEVSQWVKTPRVTLTVTRSRPGIIYVAGAVLRPGTVELLTDPRSSLPLQNNLSGAVTAAPNVRLDLTLANVLASAGGVLPHADLEHITVTHHATGQQQVINLWSLLRDGNPGADVPLQSGDSIQVPAGSLGALAAMDDADFKTLVRSSIGVGTFPVRVAGFVNAQGMVELTGPSPFLSSAIMKAGGYLPSANRKVVAIRRLTKDNEFSTLYVDPNKVDLVLRPNDIVVVAEQPAFRGARFAESIARIIQPFASMATTALGYEAFVRGLKE